MGGETDSERDHVQVAEMRPALHHANTRPSITAGVEEGTATAAIGTRGRLHDCELAGEASTLDERLHVRVFSVVSMFIH